MRFQDTERDVKPILSDIPGMLSQKNSKNQKKQSVQLFCQKNHEFSFFHFQSWYSHGISLENGNFKADFHTRLRLVWKYAFQLPFSNSIPMEMPRFQVENGKFTVFLTK